MIATVPLPKDRDEQLQQAIKFHRALKYPEADRIYREIITTNPTWIFALWNYANLRHQLKQDKEAASLYTKCITSPDIAPNVKAMALNNLGVILLNWGEIDKAAKSFVLSERLDPELADAKINLAVVARRLGDYSGADDMLKRALKMDKSRAEVHSEISFLSLLMGDFERGWNEYEWRFRVPNFPTPQLKTNRPRYNGQKLNGKRVLLTQEQGLGDTLHFIRYAKMVKERGAKVLAFVPKELGRVLLYVEGIDELHHVIDLTDQDFDFHIPMLSLPRVFKTRLDSVPNERYIHWGQSKDIPGKFRVGIVWAGRPEHGNDKMRSTTIDTFAPLFDLPDISWYSLQYGARSGDVAKYPQVVDLVPHITDFSDSATFLNSLDLVISVDTAIVHLAGAMHRPVWTMIPHSPDWRWMLDRQDSPWYPTMRLYRQPKKGDWDSVISAIKTDLQSRKVWTQ